MKLIDKDYTIQKQFNQIKKLENTIQQLRSNTNDPAESSLDVLNVTTLQPIIGSRSSLLLQNHGRRCSTGAIPTNPAAKLSRLEELRNQKKEIENKVRSATIATNTGTRGAATVATVTASTSLLSKSSHAADDKSGHSRNTKMSLSSSLHTKYLPSIYDDENDDDNYYPNRNNQNDVVNTPVGMVSKMKQKLQQQQPQHRHNQMKRTPQSPIFVPNGGGNDSILDRVEKIRMKRDAVVSPTKTSFNFPRPLSPKQNDVDDSDLLDEQQQHQEVVSSFLIQIEEKDGIIHQLEEKVRVIQIDLDDARTRLSQGQFLLEKQHQQRNRGVNQNCSFSEDEDQLFAPQQKYFNGNTTTCTNESELSMISSTRTWMTTSTPSSSSLDQQENDEHQQQQNIQWPVRVAQLEGELEEVYEKLKHAERTIIYLKEGNVPCPEQATSAELQVIELKSALQDAHEKIGRLTTTQNSIQHFQQKQQESLSDVEQYTYDQLCTLSKESKDKCNLLQYQIRMLEQACDVDDISTIPSKISNLQQSLLAAQTEHDKASNDFTDLLENQDCLFNELDSAHKEIQVLQNDLSIARVMNTSAEKTQSVIDQNAIITVMGLSKELDEQKKECTTRGEQIRELLESCRVDDISSIPGVISKLKEKVAKAEAYQTETEIELCKLIERNKSLLGDLENTRKSNTELDKNALTTVASLRTELDEQRAVHTARNEQIRLILESCKIDDISLIPRKISNLEEKLVAAQNRRSATENELFQLTEENKSMLIELESTREAKMNLVQSTIAAITQLKKELEEHNAAYNARDEQIRIMLNYCHVDDISLLPSKVSNLEEKLSSAQTHQLAAEKELYQLTEKNKSLLEELEIIGAADMKLIELQDQCGVANFYEIPRKFERLEKQRLELETLLKDAEERLIHLDNTENSLAHVQGELAEALQLLDTQEENTEKMGHHSFEQDSFHNSYSISDYLALHPHSDADIHQPQLAIGDGSRSSLSTVGSKWRCVNPVQAELEVARLSRMLLDSHVKTEEVERRLIDLSIACDVNDVNDIPAKMANFADDAAFLDEMYNTLQQTEQQVAELQQKLEEAVDALTKSEDIVSDLRNELSEATSKLNATEDELVSQNAVVNELNETSRSLKVELDEQYTKTSALECVVRDLTEKLDELKCQRDAVAEPCEVERLENMLDRKGHEIAMLQVEIDERTRELAKARALIEEIEHARDYNSSKVSELQSVLSLRNQDDVDEQLMNKSLECAQLNAEKDTLQRKLLVAETRAKTLQDENVQKAALLRDMGSRYGSDMSAEKFIESLQQENERTLKRATESSMKLAECQMRIDELTETLKKVSKAKRENTDRQLVNENLSESSHARVGRFAFTQIQQMKATVTARLSHLETASSHSQRGANPEVDDVVRRLSNKIAVLEDQNKAYALSLEAMRLGSTTMF